MQSSHSVSMELSRLKLSVSYVQEIGGGSCDMTDCLDGINNTKLSHHLSIIKRYMQGLGEEPNKDSYVEYCSKLITLTLHVYATRFRPDEHVLNKDLRDLKTGCHVLAEGLLAYIASA